MLSPRPSVGTGHPSDGEHPYQPGPVTTAVAFVAIFGLCLSAVHFAPGDSDIAAWWPAAGIGTGLLALSPRRRWPALLLLTVLVTGAANAVGGRDLGVSGLFGIANASEGLVAVLVLGAWNGRPWLRSLSDFARLIAATAAGAATAGLLVGAAVHLVLDGSWLSSTFDVVASHSASQLLVVPVALLLTDRRARLANAQRPPLVTALQVLATVTTTILVFRIGQELPLSFLPVPLLVWGALVLSLRAAAAEALAVGAMVTFLTSRGGGPFADIAALSTHTTAALVQVNLVVIALATLPLALVVAERESALREAIAGREASRLSQVAIARALEKERQVVERLSDLDRSKSEFMATVSHELRTPMTSILGFNQLLAGEVVGPLNDRQRDLLRRVDRGSQRLLGLIENILALSRVETMKDRSSHVDTELRAVVTRALEATDHLRWDRTLDLRVMVPTDGSDTVRGDPGQLERAMVNLISNATKFTRDHGTITVRLDFASPDSVTIAVSDTGIGIPAEDQGQLFDSFYRASNAVSETIQGTGLGLAIVRTIVAAHEGELTLVSAIDEGTTVTVVLPRGAAPAQAPASSSPTRRISSVTANGLTT